MRIVVLPPRGVTFPENSSWMALIHGLRKAGHEVGGFGYGGGKADSLVVLNHQPDTKRVQTHSGIRPEHTALISLEPRVTAPAMYQRSVLSLYGLRFAASPLWAEQIDGDPFLWPQEFERPIVRSEPTLFTASLINGDKRSAVGGSLYGLRRSVIKAFDDSSIPLAVFGPGWRNSSTQRVKQAARAIAKATSVRMMPDLPEALGDLNLRPSHWLGSVEVKSQAFARAPLSIIIENSKDYVSEKLIDAICAGVVPLYVGPPLGEFGLPSDIAVECESNAEAILNAVGQLSRERQAAVVEAGRQWLLSPESREHDIHVVLENLGRQIGDRLNHS